MPAPTPSQTVGPFYSIGCCRRDASDLVRPGDPGALRLAGTLFDAAGDPVVDGLVELWDAAGRRWGRCGTHPDGEFRFVVSRPESDGAPHFEAVVFARGLLRHQLTRIYFPDEPRNDVDPLLVSLSPAERATLIARRDDDGLRFDIRLQGDDQTVFFGT